MTYFIDPEACNFCKKCIDECPPGAIIEGKAGDKDICIVKEAECIDCGACEDVCESDPKALKPKD